MIKQTMAALLLTTTGALAIDVAYDEVQEARSGYHNGQPGQSCTLRIDDVTVPQEHITVPAPCAGLTWQAFIGYAGRQGHTITSPDIDPVSTVTNLQQIVPEITGTPVERFVARTGMDTSYQDFLLSPESNGDSLQNRVEFFFTDGASYDTDFGTWTLRTNGRGNKVADYRFDNYDNMLLTFRPISDQNYRLVINDVSFWSNSLTNLAEQVSRAGGNGRLNLGVDGGDIGNGFAAELRALEQSGNIVELITEQ